MSSAVVGRYHQFQSEYICSYWGTITPPEIIGPVAEGIRFNVFVTDGEVAGPKMRGRIRPMGGDAVVLRRDGVGIMDVRITFELEDGALIYTAYSGIADPGPDAYDRFLQGTAPDRVELRVAPRFHTSHPDYLWLNRLQCVGIGVVDMNQSKATYDIYALR